MRPDAVPIIDGGPAGDGYLVALEELLVKPRCAVRYGSGAAVECPVAWIVEQPLTAPGVVLAELLPDTSHEPLGDFSSGSLLKRRTTSLPSGSVGHPGPDVQSRCRLITGVYGLQL
jgi:hypothetical protein